MKNLDTQESRSPKSIAIIMDGNRRFADKLGLTKKEGHVAGYKKLQEICKLTKESGIRELVVYAFSTENWKREESEVKGLLSLLATALEERNNFPTGVRIRVIGEREDFDFGIQTAIERIEAETKENTEYTLTIALSYGGRAEIVAAVNSLLQKNQVGTKLTEESFAKELWGGDIVPDMVIRTGGEKRFSNFLPWQTVYSELFFTDTLWPEFSATEFSAILAEYTQRERRFGK